MGMLTARSSAWTCTCLLIVGALAACEQEASVERAVAADTRAPVATENASTGDAAEASRLERKQVRNARMSIEVASCEDARREIEADVAARAGFVANADLKHLDGRISNAYLVLRIPPAELAGALQRYAQLGTVLREELDTRDITDDYYDIEARMGSARQLEARLIQLLSTNTAELADVLKVEHELARVRETIERHEGKLRLWSSQVALSTLTIELVELVERSSHVAESPGLAARIGQTFDSSWGAMLSVGEAFVHLLVALSPWVPPFALFAWLCLCFSRAVNRRRARSLTDA
jgi:Domain of unknown function (DUF4349)